MEALAGRTARVRIRGDGARSRLGPVPPWLPMLSTPGSRKMRGGGGDSREDGRVSLSGQSEHGISPYLPSFVWWR